MAKFIELSRQSKGDKIHINVDHIVAITEGDDHTVVVTSLCSPAEPAARGILTFKVTESRMRVLAKISVGSGED